MDCPFCGKTAQATPEDRTDKNGRTFQVKVYKWGLIGCRRVKRKNTFLGTA